MDNYDTRDYKMLTTAELLAAGEVARDLCNAFAFADTPQGHDYFWDLYGVLREMGELGEEQQANETGEEA